MLGFMCIVAYNIYFAFRVKLGYRLEFISQQVNFFVQISLFFNASLRHACFNVADSLDKVS